MVGYRVYRSPSITLDRSLLSIFALAILCMGAALLINRWHGLTRVMSVSFLMLTFAAIPFLFRATKDQAIDRNLGELSYPIYICHYLVIWFLDSVMAFGSNVIRGIAIIGLTILVSSALYWWVDRPVDGWRQRRLLAKRIAEPGVGRPNG